MCAQTESTVVIRGMTVSFARACQRIADNLLWDIVDYHFSLKMEGESCDIAVGVATFSFFRIDCCRYVAFVARDHFNIRESCTSILKRH